MFETFKLISSLKKLTNNNASNIPLDIIKDVATKVKSNYYSIEQASVMVLRVSLNLGYLDREVLTKKGEELVSKDEDFEKEYGEND